MEKQSIRIVERFGDIMNKLYQVWIIIKYKWYVLYWKFKKPEPPSKFFGWTEINYDVLDKNAVAYGEVISENDTKNNR